tara:strand:+ start:1091 stop:1525 length:435 start_codon:yes stop_codon:yes gene_type:complete
MKVKSFRGILLDGGQDRIRLSTNNGLTGYKINKFEIMSANPSAGTGEHIVKIFTFEQTTVTGTVNFADPTLLAAATLKTNSSTGNPETIQQVIFDHVKFNQDVFVTGIDVNDSNAINYYIELEQVKLSVDEAAVATLKDMRGRE